MDTDDWTKLEMEIDEENTKKKDVDKLIRDKFPPGLFLAWG